MPGDEPDPRADDANNADEADEAGDIDDLIGRLLVASPQLGDPNFERTVVLILDHGPEGALGVVLNRPTGLPVDEILAAWTDKAEATPPGVVFRGGPVSPDAVIGLARTPLAPTPAAGTPSAGTGSFRPQTGHRGTDGEDEEGADRSPWRLVLAGVGTVDLTVAPEEQPVTVAGVRMFAGYAGWSPEQLEEELAEGAWIVLDAEVADVFTVAADALWHDVLQRQGGKLALLASYPPHPSVN